MNHFSQNLEHFIWNLQLFQFVLLDLELFNQVKHSPSVRVLDIHSFQGLLQQNISQFVSTFVVRWLKDNLNNKVDEVSSDNIGVSDQIQREFDKLVSQLGFQSGDKFLRLNKKVR